MNVAQRELVRVVGLSVVVGIVAGFVWAFITPTPQARVLPDGSAVVPGDQIGAYFAGVGVFTLLMLGAGLIVGIVAWWLGRSWRGPLGVVLMVLGSVMAGAFGILVGGSVLARRLPDPVGLHPGQVFAVAPDLWMDVTADGALSTPGLLLIVAPFVATFCYLCCVLMSRSADLGRGDGGVAAEASVSSRPVTAGIE